LDDQSFSKIDQYFGKKKLMFLLIMVTKILFATGEEEKPIPMILNGKDNKLSII